MSNPKPYYRVGGPPNRERPRPGWLPIDRWGNWPQGRTCAFNAFGFRLGYIVKGLGFRASNWQRREVTCGIGAPTHRHTQGCGGGGGGGGISCDSTSLVPNRPRIGLGQASEASGDGFRSLESWVWQWLRVPSPLAHRSLISESARSSPQPLPQDPKAQGRQVRVYNNNNNTNNITCESQKEKG